MVGPAGSSHCCGRTRQLGVAVVSPKCCGQLSTGSLMSGCTSQCRNGWFLPVARQEVTACLLLCPTLRACALHHTHIILLIWHMHAVKPDCGGRTEGQKFPSLQHSQHLQAECCVFVRKVYMQQDIHTCSLGFRLLTLRRKGKLVGLRHHSRLHAHLLRRLVRVFRALCACLVQSSPELR